MARAFSRSLAINRVSNNVGGVKRFSSTLQHSRGTGRHFALAEDVPIEPKPVPNQCQVWNSVRPMHLFGHTCDHDY